ncbi:hypothetical protein [Streptomyces sp. NPDC015131]|uniref:hypothetical protein n=1 Tax=Streptomyces sp. NPDC015131 TaxID=3364941 RepID=UPI0036FCE27C
MSWGFCSHCHRLEPVDDGVLVEHFRSASTSRDKSRPNTICGGSGEAPSPQPGPDVPQPRCPCLLCEPARDEEADADDD